MRYLYAFVTAALLLAPGLASADPDPDDADALTTVLGYDPVRDRLALHSGLGVFDFRLYTSAKASTIAWWRDEKLYLYAVRGEDHDRRALDLLERLQQNGLASFLAPQRAERRVRFSEVYDVEAIQIVGPLHAERPSEIRGGGNRRR